jgi:hypothetical protein
MPCFPRIFLHFANSPGAITFARSRSSGKSRGFRVTMNSARPDSAQRQKSSSFGSGDIPDFHRTVTHSARFRIRFTTLPMRLGRTPSRPRTCLYSSRISSVTSQVKFPDSAHLHSRSALAFRPGTNGSRNARDERAGVYHHPRFVFPTLPLQR